MKKVAIIKNYVHVKTGIQDNNSPAHINSLSTTIGMDAVSVGLIHTR